jgi:hypothetical protein
MENSLQFTRFRFRPGYFFGLTIALFGGWLAIFFGLDLIDWPSGTTFFTLLAIKAGAMIIYLGLWLILYRNTRPKDQAYYQRRHLSGRLLIIMIVLLPVLMFITYYYLLAAETVADFTWKKYLTGPYLTDFGLTWGQLLSQWSLYASILPFQLMHIGMLVGVATFFSPQLVPTLYKKAARKAGSWGAMAIVGMGIIVLGAYLGWGWIWQTTQGRNYIFVGLFPEQYSLYFIPNLLFIGFGSIIYLRARHYFWSDPEKPEFHGKAIGKWLILSTWIVFNLWFSWNTIISEFLLHEVGLTYAIFLLLETAFVTGIILHIQANHAIMGGSPSQSIRIISRVMWGLFFLGLLLYMAIFFLQVSGIKADLGELIVFMPSLGFSGILTPAIYYGVLTLQNRLGGSKNE